MIEVLFFAVPAAIAVLLTLPSYFLFPLIRSHFPAHGRWVAAAVGLLFALGVFTLFSIILVVLGVPADENAGEAVVLFLWISLMGMSLSQIVYWAMWIFTGRR